MQKQLLLIRQPLAGLLSQQVCDHTSSCNCAPSCCVVHA
jgi:hypothetical protein